MKWIFHKHVRQLVLLGFLGAVAVLAYLHWWGVPDRIKSAVLAELSKRGINAEIGSLTFDPWRGLVAEEVLVRLPGTDRLSLKADEIRLNISFLPLLKRQLVVEELAFSESVFSCELSQEGGGVFPLEVRNVNGAFAFNAQRELIIKELAFKFLNLAFEVEGTLGAQQSGVKAEQMERKPIVLKKEWVELIQKWQRVAISQPLILHLSVSGDIRQKETLSISAKLRGKDVQYDSVFIRQARGELKYRSGAVRIEHLALETGNGSFELQGEYQTETRNAQLELQCKVFPRFFAPFLSDEKRKLLEGWNFSEPASVAVSGKATNGNWPGAQYELKIHAGNFSYKNVPFRDLRVRADWKEGKLTAPEIIVTRSEGNLTGSLSWDRQTDLCHFAIDSYLNFDEFEPIFPEKSRNAFKTFTLKKAPVIQLEGTCKFKEPDSFKAKGSFDLVDFEGNGVSIKSLRCKLDIDGPVIRLTRVEAVKKEGTLNGDFALNTKTGDLTIGAVSDIYPIDLAAIIGPRTKTSLEPYHFKTPPHVTWNGVYNLKKAGLNDLRMNVTCSRFNWWKLNMNNVKAQVWMGPQSIEIRDLTSSFHKGTLKSDVVIDLTGKDSKVAFNIDLAAVDFRPLTEDLFGYKEVEGKLTAKAWAAGVTGRPETWLGEGQLAIQDGELWKIPIFGDLSKVLGTIIPGFGSPKARYAETKFKIRDGYADMDDIKIDSLVVTLTAKGKYYFDQRLDFIVQGHLLRKLFFIGWVLDPLTKIVELKLTGTLSKWEWETRYIPGL